jgi:hypothetical protein
VITLATGLKAAPIVPWSNHQMSDNLPDFLNDNAGVVAAGLGVGINRNLTRLRAENAKTAEQLKNIHRHAVRERREELREKEAKEIVFNIHSQLSELRSSEISVNLYYQVRNWASEVSKHGISSESFKSLQDKEFFRSVQSELQRLMQAIDAALPYDTKVQVAEFDEWYTFYLIAYAVARVDAQNEPQEHSSPHPADDIVAWVISEFKSDTGIDLSQKPDAIERIKVEAAKAREALSSTPEYRINLPFITADSSGPKHFNKTLTPCKLRDCTDNNSSRSVSRGKSFWNSLFSRERASEDKVDASLSRQQQRRSNFLQEQRSLLAEAMSAISAVPEATREYFSATSRDRMSKLDEVRDYVRALSDFLGVNPSLLPEVPELKWLKLTLDVAPPWPAQSK